MVTDKYVNNLLISLSNSNEILRVYAEKFAKSVHQISAYYIFRQRNNRHFFCCHGNTFFIKFQIYTKKISFRQGNSSHLGVMFPWQPVLATKFAKLLIAVEIKPAKFGFY